jgi:hypothetical protein
MDSVGSVGHEAQVVELDWQWDKTSSLLYLASANQSFGSEPGALSVVSWWPKHKAEASKKVKKETGDLRAARRPSVCFHPFIQSKRGRKK